MKQITMLILYNKNKITKKEKYKKSKKKEKPL